MDILYANPFCDNGSSIYRSRKLLLALANAVILDSESRGTDNPLRFDILIGASPLNKHC
jgi:hypothetical protein